MERRWTARDIVRLIFFIIYLLSPLMPAGVALLMDAEIQWSDVLFAAGFIYGVPIMAVSMWAFLDWITADN